MTSTPRAVWDQLTQDPRVPGNEALRASDKDRDVVLSVLGEAYAEGRLDREELDERTTRVQRTKRLGELVEPLSDLVGAESAPRPVVHEVAPPARDVSPAPSGPDLGHLTPFLVPTLVCWAIWVFTCFGPQGFEPYFPWPLFVTLGTAGMAFGHRGRHPWHGHPGRRRHELARAVRDERRLARRGR